MAWYRFFFSRYNLWKLCLSLAQKADILVNCFLIIGWTLIRWEGIRGACGFLAKDWRKLDGSAVKLWFFLLLIPSFLSYFIDTYVIVSLIPASYSLACPFLLLFTTCHPSLAHLIPQLINLVVLVGRHGDFWRWCSVVLIVIEIFDFTYF